jgi:GTPase
MAIFKNLLTDTKIKLIEENDDGNIEYKWRLDLKTETSIKKLVSQMLWRLNEGKDSTGIYEAHYVLGVYDNGEIGNLSKEDLNITVDTNEQKNMKVQFLFH